MCSCVHALQDTFSKERAQRDHRETTERPDQRETTERPQRDHREATERPQRDHIAEEDADIASEPVAGPPGPPRKLRVSTA